MFSRKLFKPNCLQGVMADTGVSKVLGYAHNRIAVQWNAHILFISFTSKKELNTAKLNWYDATNVLQ